jgi:hypothetical protein
MNTVSRRGALGVVLAGALIAGTVGSGYVSIASADITTRTHYRCYNHTLRVSPGGWVSHYQTAVNNCNAHRRGYPNHRLEVQSQTY